MKQLTIKAPCKINLSLDICGRLPNGYHEMDMVMQTVGLCDTITLTVPEKTGISMTCSDQTLACDDSNICVRCAKVFFEQAKLPPKVHIHLEKYIPMMAGLGGGSADGAAVLCGLNKLYGTGLSCEELCEIGFQIGVDIPFCIRGGTQRVQGAGERMSDAPKLGQSCYILIAKPSFPVSTKLAFQGFDQQTDPQRADVDGMMQALKAGELSGIADKLSNVFEPFCRPEEIGTLKAIMLQQGAAGALMSGSGSAVFALFEQKAQAEACAKVLRPMVEQVDIVQPLSSGIFDGINAIAE